MTQDIRHAIRLLHRNKSFTSAVVLTHGLGVAVTCAVVTIAYALLRPLPYPDPHQLVHLKERAAREGGGTSSYPDFLEIRRQSRTFAHVAGYDGGSRTLTSPGAPAERVPTAHVTDGFFEALGVVMAAGRSFDAADMRRDAPPVVILTDGGWRRRFGADPAIVGRTITLAGVPNTIVGVLPPSFEFPPRGYAELWLPVRPTRAQEERQYFHWLDLIARVKPNVSEAQIADDLRAIGARFKETDPQYHADARLTTIPLQDEILGSMRSSMLLLLGGVALVMLVTCANVAGLLLARAPERDREMAVRVAVGANHRRLARQLLIESVTLGLPGALLGIAGGQVLARGFVAALPASRRVRLPRLQEMSLDPSVVAMTTVIALAAAVIFGLAPAWRVGRGAIASAGSGRTTPDVREGRLRAALVSAQIALALILLASAGLVGKSVYRVLQVSPGFDSTNLLTMRITLSGARYRSPDRVTLFHDALLQRVRALPGVAGAESIDDLPFEGRGNTATFSIDGRPDPTADASRSASIRVVSGGYFRVMGIPVMAGREFGAGDGPSSPRVVLVNRAFAERYFRGGALQHRLSFALFADQPAWEIVGIVGNEQFLDLDREPIPVIYFAVPQTPPNTFGIVVRAAGSAAGLTSAIRGAAASMDPNLPIYDMRTMEQMKTASVFLRRMMLWLLAIFAGATVFLAAIGVYGVLAQSVAARTREIGVRVALGAERRDVIRLMLARGLAPAVVGILIGLPATLAVTRVLRTLLFGVTPTDAATLAAGIVLMVVVAVAACLIPTWRAIRIDPAAAIRQE